MHYANLNKEMFIVFKASTQAAMGTMSMLGNQAERMTNFFVDNTIALHKEGQKCVEQWIESAKKNQAQMKVVYVNLMESLSDLVQTEDEQAQAQDRPAKRKAKKR